MGDAEGQLRMDLEAEHGRTKVLWTLSYKLNVRLLCFQKGFSTRSDLSHPPRRKTIFNHL